ncbi:MAG TPA: hypothetical protein DEQ14_03380 [Treponema sp.]|nr:hypothetical protein [Treponema sp.]
MKKILIFGICLSSILLLGSCISAMGATTNVFDASIPIEETATLKFGPGWIVNAYNGINVELDRPGAYEMKFTGFTIPAGQTEIEMDLYYREGSPSYGYTTFTADDVMLRYNFEAGKEYYIQFSFINADGRVPTVAVGSGVKRALIMTTLDQEDPRVPLYYMTMTFE